MSYSLFNVAIIVNNLKIKFVRENQCFNILRRRYQYVELLLFVQFNGVCWRGGGGSMGPRTIFITFYIFLFVANQVCSELQ